MSGTNNGETFKWNKGLSPIPNFKISSTFFIFNRPFENFDMYEDPLFAHQSKFKMRFEYYIMYIKSILANINICRKHET